MGMEMCRTEKKQRRAVQRSSVLLPVELIRHILEFIPERRVTSAELWAFKKKLPYVYRFIPFYLVIGLSTFTALVLGKHKSGLFEWIIENEVAPIQNIQHIVIEAIYWTTDLYRVFVPYLKHTTYACFLNKSTKKTYAFIDFRGCPTPHLKTLHLPFTQHICAETLTKLPSSLKELRACVKDNIACHVHKLPFKLEKIWLYSSSYLFDGRAFEHSAFRNLRSLRLEEVYKGHFLNLSCLQAMPNLENLDLYNVNIIVDDAIYVYTEQETNRFGDVSYSCVATSNVEEVVPLDITHTEDTLRVYINEDVSNVVVYPPILEEHRHEYLDDDDDSKYNIRKLRWDLDPAHFQMLLPTLKHVSIIHKGGKSFPLLWCHCEWFIWCFRHVETLRFGDKLLDASSDAFRALLGNNGQFEYPSPDPLTFPNLRKLVFHDLYLFEETFIWAPMLHTLELHDINHNLELGDFASFTATLRHLTFYNCLDVDLVNRNDDYDDAIFHLDSLDIIARFCNTIRFSMPPKDNEIIQCQTKRFTFNGPKKCLPAIQRFVDIQRHLVDFDIST